jgi:hypothetical protein
MLFKLIPGSIVLKNDKNMLKIEFFMDVFQILRPLIIIESYAHPPSPRKIGTVAAWAFKTFKARPMASTDSV